MTENSTKLLENGGKDPSRSDFKHEPSNDQHIGRSIVSGAACLIMMIGSGASSGYNAILLPQLENPGSPVKLTTGVKSWITGLAIVPYLFASLTTGYLIDRYGRRFGFMLSSVTYTVGWLFVALANGIGMLSVGRLLTGFGQASIVMVYAVFLGETMSPEYRGILLASSVNAFTFGILIIHVMGTYIHWKLTALIWSIIGIIGYIIFLHLPDTPASHAKNGRFDKARRSFKYYRGDSAIANEEFEKTMRATLETTTLNEHSTSIYSRLRKPEYMKPLILVSIYLFLQQGTGFNIVIFFTIYILKAAMGSEAVLDEYSSMIILDLARFLISFIGTVLSKKLGRRVLGLSSAISTSLSLTLLTSYLYMVKYHLIENSTAIFILLMVLYISTTYVGSIQVPYMLMGEVLPKDIRGLAASWCSLVTFSSFFATVTFVPYLLESLGVEGIFSICCLFTVLGSVYLYFFLPETKDKTLLEIEIQFRDSK